MSLSILRSGLLTTVQDLGRTGYQQHGIPVSGAMDAVALRVANLLVGNDESTGGLEITLHGPIIRFEADHLIALTGAHLSPTLDEQPAPMHRPIWVPAGAVLAFGAAVAGCRAYLAVSGGFALPPVLGSQATYQRAGLGGLHGRALQAGDQLPGRQLMQTIQAKQIHAKWTAATWTPGPTLCPRPRPQPVVRVVQGPEYEQFSAESRQQFLKQPFAITPQSDRMGYRLQGPALARETDVELLSSAVTFGTVQVPPNGQPIILMADRQTTGGYPRIAQVITADFGALAQAVPGQFVRFQEVSLAEAQALYLAQEQLLRDLRRGVKFKISTKQESL